MSVPGALTCESYALFCDEYELTMAQSFWLHGQNDIVDFELFVRHLPDHRGYLVAAGLAQVLAYLGGLCFSAGDVEALRDSGKYEAGFLEFLQRLRFNGDVYAVAEGTVIGAATPLLRVRAPRIEATVAESTLLAIVNHQTTIASKAARMVQAAGDREMWDFSLRRVHGPEAALGVARAAYIAGFTGTATVAAGVRLGIPTAGTMAHHYVLSFGAAHEQEAFEQFLRDYPNRALLLIDTYDTLQGAQRAIAASRAAGVALAGVRIDSGDIEVESRAVRAAFDDAGMNHVRIFASGDLDEYRIAELVAAGAPVDAFGVGTMLGTSFDAPALGGVYKLVAVEDGRHLTPVMKQSPDKVTDPGVHQVFRTPEGDVLGLADEDLEGTPLLQLVMHDGIPEVTPSLEQIRAHCVAERAAIPEPQRALDAPVPLPLSRSERLLELRRRLTREAHGQLS